MELDYEICFLLGMENVDRVWVFNLVYGEVYFVEDWYKVLNLWFGENNVCVERVIFMNTCILLI